jgi:dUTP pyrophosphatase
MRQWRLRKMLLQKISNMLKVKIVNKSKWDNPAYATQASAGMDLHANVDEPFTLQPLERRLVPTGIFIELPVGYEAQVRPRSGLATKHGITVINSPGTVDADFRGELKVSLVNLSNEPFEIVPGERIAQMIVSKHERVEWVNVDELSETERGAGGWGSTGTK